MTNEEQFKSINYQLDLVNLLGNMKREEIASAFEIMSRDWLKEIALMALNVCNEVAA